MTAYHSIVNRLRAGQLAAAVTLAMMTAACGSDTTFWSPAASPKVNKVELVNLNHDVAFQGSSVQMDAAALGGLDAFLSRQQVGYGDRIYVVGAAKNPNPISTRRAQGIADYLRRRGIGAMVLPSAEWAGASSPGMVRVLVHRYVVRSPACPDWRKPPADYGNTTSSNFGCATAVNLGLMVADPRDLISGGEAGYADGTREAAAVKRYRDDKVTPLDNTGIVENSGGSK